jgi:hypothetical protein
MLALRVPKRVGPSTYSVPCGMRCVCHAYTWFRIVCSS